jgi:CheY-like chemotaxis protein
MKVLVATTNNAFFAGLVPLLGHLGLEPEQAPGGLYVLTLMEHGLPSAVISDYDLEDMNGFDVYEIVRADPANSEVAFVLLDDSQQGAVEHQGDVALEAGALPSAIVAAVRQALERKGHRFATPGVAAAPPAPTPAAANTIETIMLGPTPLVADIADLINSFSRNNRTGGLQVIVKNQEAWVYFFKGRVIHAVFGNETGQPALVKVFLGADRSLVSALSFHTLSAEILSKNPVSISIPTNKLLYKVMFEMNLLREAGSAL